MQLSNEHPDFDGLFEQRVSPNAAVTHYGVAVRELVHKLHFTYIVYQPDCLHNVAGKYRIPNVGLDRLSRAQRDLQRGTSMAKVLTAIF